MNVDNYVIPKRHIGQYCSERLHFYEISNNILAMCICGVPWSTQEAYFVMQKIYMKLHGVICYPDVQPY